MTEITQIFARAYILFKGVLAATLSLWEKLRTNLGYDADRLPKWFPKNPQQLSTQLRRLAPFLRKRGREVDFPKSGKRFILINAIEEEEAGESASDTTDATECQQETDL